MILFPCFFESEAKRGNKCLEYAEKMHNLVKNYIQYFDEDCLFQTSSNLGLAHKRAKNFKKAEKIYLHSIQVIESNPILKNADELRLESGTRVKIYGLKSERGRTLNGQVGELKTENRPLGWCGKGMLAAPVAVQRQKLDFSKNRTIKWAICKWGIGIL